MAKNVHEAGLASVSVVFTCKISRETDFESVQQTSDSHTNVMYLTAVSHPF